MVISTARDILERCRSSGVQWSEGVQASGNPAFERKLHDLTGFYVTPDLGSGARGGRRRGGSRRGRACRPKPARRRSASAVPPFPPPPG